MESRIKWWHRIKLPDGSYTPGLVYHGPDGGDWPTTRFGLPEDLTSKSVLDIGCWDGFFSFEAERRGADYVMAIDKYQSDEYGSAGFEYASKVLNSQVQWFKLDIENPRVKDYNLGEFDIVLFYGVLYHLEAPLIGLKNAASQVKPKGVLLLETAMSDIDTDKAVLEYCPGINNDPNNFFYPNESWIRTAAKECGFLDVSLVSRQQDRATYKLTK